MSEVPATPHPQQNQLPQAPEAEAAYLGAVIAGIVTAGELVLDTGEFFQERHQHIYELAMESLMEGEPFDTAILAEALRATGDLDLVGGPTYLNQLLSRGLLVTPAQADEHVRLIREKAEARRVIAEAQRAALAAANGSGVAAAIKRLRDSLDTSESRLAAGRMPRYSTDVSIDDRLGRIEWLWPGYIPRGFVTAVVGPQEAGKSNLCLDLCARLLQRQPWPDGAEAPLLADDQQMLWVDTEMALAALAERLNDWRVPRGRFVLPEDPLRQLQLDNPADWQWIESAIRHFRPPLVVIDSLSGGHRSEEKDNDAMKGILLRLSQLAQENKIAVVVIHHLRKAGIGEPDFPVTIDRVRGASAITQFCRSILALGVPDKTQPDLRRVDVIKSNFSRHRIPLGYQITDNGLAWGAAPEPPSAAKPIDEARAFLLEALTGGQRPCSELFAEAQALGIAQRTLVRAKEDLKLKARKEGGTDGRWFWSFAHAQSEYPTGKIPD